MKRVPGWLIVLLGVIGLARRRDADEDGERIVEPGDRQPRAEAAVIVLLLMSALAAAGFVVAYGLGASIQVMGAALGGSLALLSAALIVVAKRLVVAEELPEEYSSSHPEEQEKIAEIVEESGSRLTRKRLLAAAAGAAGTSIGVALITPAVSLGPLFDSSPLYRTPWRAGRRLVDKHGRPLIADDIELESFYTAYPEGASQDDLGAPVVVVRLEPTALQLPRGREGWAPEGILAYSKICTHAGCAIALYRTPKFSPAQPRPALVCPCHYSTFDPATGAEVLFGPAGRPLPQLPLTIAAGRELRAAGNYSGPVGPSWSGVRSKPPT
jgi:ubiquinol-cytochrome c reductase iron-sulfur subunit